MKRNEGNREKKNRRNREEGHTAPAEAHRYLDVFVVLVALSLILEASEQRPSVRIGGVDEDDLRVLEGLQELHPHVGLVAVGRHRPQERDVDILRRREIEEFEEDGCVVVGGGGAVEVLGPTGKC